MVQSTGQMERGGDTAEHGESAPGGVDWEDPSVPVGNAPRLPRWPLVLFAVAWVAWVGFLLVVALSDGSGVAA